MRTITAAGKGVLAVMPTECSEAKVITEGGFGYVFDNEDIDGLANKLDDFCLDPEITARLGNKARSFFDENFEMEHCISKIERQILNLFTLD